MCTAGFQVIGLQRLIEGVVLVSGVALAVAVRTVRVDGRRVLPPALSNQLVETVAEVLDLTGAQDTSHPHQMSVAPTAATVGMTTPT